MDPALLARLTELLAQFDPESARWLAEVVADHNDDPDGLRRALNSARMWGGPGSVASQALNPNPGLPEQTWQMLVRELRQAMVELGEALRAVEPHNPDIDSWMLAFSNWNQAER